MDRVEYINDPSVKAFAGWLGERLDGAGSLKHSYINRKTGRLWDCDSLYDACIRYTWSFTCSYPLGGGAVKGKTLSENLELLRELRVLLRTGMLSLNADLCLKTCKAILEWGGATAGNVRALELLGEDICDYLMGANIALNTHKYRLGSLPKYIRANAGYSKIYALLLDDFVMYDSRVAAGLCWLVRLFCEEQDLAAVPDTLSFVIGPYRSEAVRNPSTARHTFVEIGANPQSYMDSNMKANWLLKSVLEERTSKFRGFGDDALMALQAGMFMIGYDVGPSGKESGK